MSYMDHVKACNAWDPNQFQPLRADRKVVGMLRHGFAEHLRRWPEVFQVADGAVTLALESAGFAARSAALHQVVEELVAAGTVSHTHGENYPVTADARDQAVCVIDRAAAPYFGIRAFGQHLNGFVRRGREIKMWIGRRAADRRLFPSRLDNMVAGGLPYGISLSKNLEKECMEEAGIASDLACRAVPVGALTYMRETVKGLKPDVLYCYDLELPADFVPRCTDGEVEEFYLWPLEEVAEIVRRSDEFKPNCNLVVIDFLIRHGVIAPDYPEYLDLIQGLHPPLQQGTRPGSAQASQPAPSP